jgi:outer membrane lipase/esterase
VFDLGRGYVSATLSGGNDAFDIERNILLGPAVRIETGSTDASHVGFALGGGLVFGDDDFRHGPFADVTWTQVEVDGFREDSGDSTSMQFDAYDRDSMVGRLGYQFESSAGAIRPFGRVAYNAENEDDQVFVGAGLNTMNGHFTMPGYAPSDNWWTAEIGVGWELNDRTTAFVSYNGLFADDLMDRHALNLGFSMDL